MYQLNFNKPVKIHFIGIGGISMSGLAEILLDRGFTVTGSDRQESALTRHLEEKGALIFYGQKAENITSDCDLIVYTAAIHPDNPEYAQGVSLGIPMMTRADLLGQIMLNYMSSIAVAGTHGKTTTTSMLAHILLAADTDPTVSVGGILPVINGNIRIGSSEYFLTEACEYTNSFLSFNPTLNIILNVEEDHLDFFKDINDIRHSFKNFAALLPEDGALVINADIDDISYFTDGLKCKSVTYSSKVPADYTAADVRYNEFAIPTFKAVENGNVIGEFTLGVPGSHNVSNALAAIAAATILGLPLESIQKGLACFNGTDRRFQYKGKYRDAVIIDDYAHHPTEIQATLTTALSYPHNRIRCIFQPHTYTRTYAFLNDFAKALSMADEVVLAPIYAARETDDLGISSKNVSDIINDLGTKSSCFDTFEEIQNYISANAEAGDLIITMGAGNIYEVGEALLKEVN